MNTHLMGASDPDDPAKKAREDRKEAIRASKEEDQ